MGVVIRVGVVLVVWDVPWTRLLKLGVRGDVVYIAWLEVWKIEFNLAPSVRTGVHVAVLGHILVINVFFVDGPVEVDEGPHVQVAQGDEEYEQTAIRIQRGVHTEQHCEDQDNLHALTEQEEPPRSHGHPAQIHYVSYEGNKVEDEVEGHENTNYNFEGEESTSVGGAKVQRWIVLYIQEIYHVY